MKTNKKQFNHLFSYSLILLFMYSLILLFPYSQVHAQSLTLPGGTPVSGILDPGTFNGNLTIGGVVTRAIPFVFAAAGIGLLLMLISSGFSFLTSAGDAKKLEEGKQRMTNAILGFVIIFAAYWIVQGAGVILGFNIIGSIFK